MQTYPLPISVKATHVCLVNVQTRLHHTIARVILVTQGKLVHYVNCVSKPCQNGGSCQTSTSGFKCICAAGYAGSSCQNVVDHCKPDPCLHSGWCVSTTNGYTCQCTSRYTGKNCQTYVTTSTAQSTTTATTTSWIKVTQPTSWKKITLPTSWLKVTLPSIAPTTGKLFNRWRSLQLGSNMF
ncbi:uncharacterized protein LOC143056181 [Mytilus galloprovincialis]|uniref:uncharacterized protein LOC143056181 n=1 Tax=Mytilus galloprovincialis TaxID=29158 RepID=UPI003F7BA65B